MSDAAGPEPGPLRRIFGSGPAGAAASVVLLLAVGWLQARMQWPTLGLPRVFRISVLTLGTLATIATVVWSVRSLPVETRGRRLCTRGAFAWVRHPLYGAFLLFFCPALAVFLDHAVYLGWAAALHPLWHAIIRGEERLMEDRFGGQWQRYAARTGRFVPRLRHRPGETP